MAMGDATGRTSISPWLVPSTLALALLPGIDLLHHAFKLVSLPTVGQTTWETALFIVALLLAMAMIGARRRPLVVVAMIGLFQIYLPPFMGWGVVYSLTNGCPLNRAAFRAMIALDRLANDVSDLKHVRLWMGPQQTVFNADGCGLDLGNFRGSANSLSLDAIGSLTDRSVNDIPNAQLAALNPGDWLALATTDQGEAADIANRLRQLQRTAGLTQWRTVKIEHIPVFLQLVPIIAAPSNGS
jgi:hypothetical protein